MSKLYNVLKKYILEINSREINMSKVAKATIGLMIVTMLSKILGFAREVVLGATYGASIYSDIYITAYNIPNVVFSVIATSLATTFIPLYYENYDIGGEEQASKFTNNIFTIVSILGVIIAMFVFIFAEPIVKLFAMGFEGEKLQITIEFTRIMIFGGVFLGLTGIIKSILQIKEDFIIPGLVGLPLNIVIIISMILSIKIDMMILPIGTLIGIASQFLFQIPFAYKRGYSYKWVLDVKDIFVKKMIHLVAPILIGVAVNQVNSIIDKTLASTLVEGSISSLNYANRLNQFVMAMFIMTIGTVVYPILSKLSNENNKEKFIKSIVQSINSVILLVIPISIGAIVLAEPIVKILFQRGEFDSRATYMTSIALIMYSIGMVAFGLRDILGKVFYSLQDTKTPMINGVMTIILNIILNIILVKYMGHAGLAFATSISAIICILLLFNSLKKKMGYFGQDKILKTMMKSLLASVVMGIITSMSYRLLISTLATESIGEVISLLWSILIGVIVYGVIIILFKVEELHPITNIVKNKLIKNQNNINSTGY